MRLFKSIVFIVLILSVRFNMIQDSDIYSQFKISEDSLFEHVDGNNTANLIYYYELALIESILEDDEHDLIAIFDPRLNRYQVCEILYLTVESTVFQASHFLLQDLDLPPPIS